MNTDLGKNEENDFEKYGLHFPQFFPKTVLFIIAVFGKNCQKCKKS